MRVLLYLIGLITVSFSQSFLQTDEIELLKKGRTFIVNHKSIVFNLSYDIWQDSYILYNTKIKNNPKIKSTFSQVDSVFIFLRDEMLYDYVLISEKKSAKESDIFLFDIIDGVLSSFKRRKINLLE